MPETDDQEGPFKVAVSCLADFVSSPGRSVESLLRPYKYSKRGEGAGRSGYYRPALNAVRKFHNSGNSQAVFQDALVEFQKRADTARDKRERLKFEKNVIALQLYHRYYGKRKFRVLSNRRIAYRIGKVVFTAQPDLWVEDENGVQVLLKIGMARKKPSYVDIVLTVIRKAAISSGQKIRAKNIVYLNVSTGKEMICRSNLKQFNRTFNFVAREIAKAWPHVTPNPNVEPDGAETKD